MNITFEDWAEHVDNSKALYERGKYGAAIYDAVFAMEMNLADMDIANKEDTLIPLAEQMNLENRTSIWGKIYHTQGAFLMQEGGEGGKRSAYRIFKYAKALDSATEEMKALTFPLVESVEQPVSESNKDGVGIVDSLLKNKKLFLLIGAIVLLGIAAVVYLLGKNKTGKNKKPYLIGYNWDILSFTLPGCAEAFVFRHWRKRTRRLRFFFSNLLSA